MWFPTIVKSLCFGRNLTEPYFMWIWRVCARKLYQKWSLDFFVERTSWVMENKHSKKRGAFLSNQITVTDVPLWSKFFSDEVSPKGWTRKLFVENGFFNLDDTQPCFRKLLSKDPTVLIHQSSTCLEREKDSQKVFPYNDRTVFCRNCWNACQFIWF